MTNFWSKTLACFTCSTQANFLSSYRDSSRNSATERRSTVKSNALQTSYPDIIDITRRKAVHHRPPKLVQLENEIIPKDNHTTRQLLHALAANSITSHLDSNQHESLVAVMKPETLEPGIKIIKEGDIGTHRDGR